MSVYSSARVLLSIPSVACSPCCAAQVRSKHLTFQAARPCWPEVLPDVCRLWPVCPTPSPITSGLGPGPLHQAWQHPLWMGVRAAARADDIQTPHPLQQHIWSLLHRRQSKWAWGEESARVCECACQGMYVWTLCMISWRWFGVCLCVHISVYFVISCDLFSTLFLNLKISLPVIFPLLCNKYTAIQVSPLAIG